MKIWWQSFVDPSQNAPYLERLEAYLNEIAEPGTTVEVHGTTPPDRDFGRLTELRCAILAIDNALEAEARGFDAFVMGHFQDPGLYEARSAVRIPVLGAGEATLHWAAQLGRRLALVSIDPVFEVWHHGCRLPQGGGATRRPGRRRHHPGGRSPCAWPRCTASSRAAARASRSRPSARSTTSAPWSPAEKGARPARAR